MKAIRWQVPFVSIGGTNYRVDIYDEGYVGNPVQLLAGDTPFTTDEDSSDDYFCPIRTQSGTLQVCTDIPEQTDYPNGGTLNLEDLLPSNNIERPVRLINVDADKIEWQGFLSCEAYSQQYTAIPQIISFPVISVLEAMDSVRLNYNTVTGINLIRRHIYRTLREIDVQTGMPDSFTDIYYSRSAWNIWRRQIDATSLYDLNERSNASSTTYVVDGMSCKKILEMLCTYMGWTCREQGTAIYFQRLGEDMGMYHVPFNIFGGLNNVWIESQEIVPVQVSEMEELEWMGDNHKRSVRQGAKSVAVEAKIEKYEFGMGLPEYPTEDVVHATHDRFESYVCRDINFNNMLSFYYYTVRIGNNGSHISVMGDSDLVGAYSDCVLYPGCDMDQQYMTFYSDQTAHPYGLTKRIGPFFAKVKYGAAEDWEDGLYITAINEMYATDDPRPIVFKMSSIAPRLLRDGSLEFSMIALSTLDNGINLYPFTGIAFVKIKFGNQYWNGTDWTTTDSFCELDFSITDEESGAKKMTLPINTIMSGEVTIEVCGCIKGGNTLPSGDGLPYYDLYITELSLEYKQPEYVIESDRDANHYYRALDTHFRDDISISTDFASRLNNILSPSLILRADYYATPLTLLAYVTPNGTEQTRPEIDLLNRMADFYSAARQTVELEVAHPATPLPLLKLNGIGDGKQYIPISESRDWHMEKSDLTCIEVPSEPPAES